MRTAIVAALLPLLCAQETTYRSQSRVVLVPVTVTDEKGRFIDGLTRDDFELLDNRHRQAIATMDTFGTGVAPIALVVAVESSYIAAPALAKVRHAGSMMAPLVAGERGSVAVISFDTQVHLVQDFTSDTGAVENAFRVIKGEGDMQARMLDAVLDGVRMLGRKANTRRVLIVISETRDRGSAAKLADVMREAQQFDVSVYAVSYSAYATTFLAKPADVPPPGDMDLLAIFTEPARLGKTNTVKALAAATGGSTAWFTREKALENIVERIGTELHSQYILGFVPEDLTPGYHRLEVRLRDGRPLRLRARPGYLANVGEPAGASPAARDEWSRPRPE